MNADWTAFDDRFPTWDAGGDAELGEGAEESAETTNDGAEEVGLAD